MALTEWTDARLDHLQEEVDAMHEVATNVAVLSINVKHLKADTSDRLDDLQTETRNGFIAIHNTLQRRDQRELDERNARVQRRARYLKLAVTATSCAGSIAAIVEGLSLAHVI